MVACCANTAFKTKTRNRSTLITWKPKSTLTKKRTSAAFVEDQRKKSKSFSGEIAPVAYVHNYVQIFLKKTHTFPLVDLISQSSSLQALCMLGFDWTHPPGLLTILAASAAGRWKLRAVQNQIPVCSQIRRGCTRDFAGIACHYRPL